MRLPPVLTAPVAALDFRQRRVFFWLTTAALVLILLWAAQARALWPRWPIADPDSWGYLHPALSKLLGGAFEHTNGRNFVYPGFLYLILRATADFGAIPFAQHALGLASAASCSGLPGGNGAAGSRRHPGSLPGPTPRSACRSWRSTCARPA